MRRRYGLRKEVIKSIALSILLALLVSSCTMKTVYVNIENHSGGDIVQDLSAEGASITTETDQDNTPSLDASLTGL